MKEIVLTTDDPVFFGRFCLMARQRRLERDGAAIVIGCRALDLLIVLVECAGTVVSKRELIGRVWPHVIVDEINLRVQISALRKALGNQHIVTVQGRGYTFVAPLTARTPSRFTTASPAPHRPMHLGHGRCYG
jgi:DNA-binding winged helix-turn-helix (wHTH) protein